MKTNTKTIIIEPHAKADPKKNERVTWRVSPADEITTRQDRLKFNQAVSRHCVELGMVTGCGKYPSRPEESKGQSVRLAESLNANGISVKVVGLVVTPF